MKDRGTVDTENFLFEVYLSANDSQSLVDELSRTTQFLDAQYKLVILEEVGKMCEYPQ
jgi:hypothetical protein